TAPPAGVTFDVEKVGSASSPDLAVLRVRALDIAEGATVRVTGARALLVIAGHDVTIGGTLDAGAHGATPGPGGALPGQGPGAGAAGGGSPGFNAAGGGAGFGSVAGGRGGAGGAVPGGAGGISYGESTLAILQGGSGGGVGSSGPCPVLPGGAGGGA